MENQPPIEKIPLIGIPAVDVNKVHQAMLALLHPAARYEITQSKFTVDQTRLFIGARILGLLKPMREEDFCELTLNAWNEQGLGLQSVSMALKRPSRTGKVRDMLLHEEWKAPTIGVIAPGMVEDGVMAEARFPVKRGFAEAVITLSPKLRMDGASSGPVAALRTEDFSRTIAGPHAVRTYLEKKSPPTEEIRSVVHSGVYACCFLKGRYKNQ